MRVRNNAVVMLAALTAAVQLNTGGVFDRDASARDPHAKKSRGAKAWDAYQARAKAKQAKAEEKRARRRKRNLENAR